MRVARLARPDGSIRYARLAEPTGEGSPIEALLLDGAPWLGGRETGERAPFDATALRAPVTPSKVVAIGRNYAAHAKELGNDVPAEPLLFLKPPSSILDPGGVVRLPGASSRVEHEAELGVVIGARARKVAPADAMAHVFGYTVICDVTARDLQRKDVQFTRAKGFDTFCPIGPWIETALDPRDVAVSLRVRRGEAVEARQHGRTRDMIFPVAQLVSYVSHVMTLEPGDVISTGTPEGVGPLVDGDAVEIEVEGIGVLRVTCAKDA
jgi:2-keto-4-pentenoate hydratase/2-oxohepta-3-ene-1,7-dioic acid hydratase in catechol pathway